MQWWTMERQTARKIEMFHKSFFACEAAILIWCSSIRKKEDHEIVNLEDNSLRNYELNWIKENQ